MNKIAKAIDHTDIRKEATATDIKNRCDEAKKYGFHGVVVNPKFTSLVSKELKGTDIKTVILIDPPMGLSSHTERVKLCRKAKKDGADELDIVLNIVDVKYDHYDKVLSDLKSLCAILPTKVIIGSGFLTDDEIIKVSKIVKKAGAFCIKTATEKDPLEHREINEKVHHLKLMKENAPGLKVKASGNIRTISDVRKVIKAGVDFIGTSSGIQIMKELLKKV
ncbi:MAG: deoxyribose-phosphate aldolase [Minisyncoccales bacterium]|jgi:deoxyribose-phosphate aldolase